MKTPDEIKKGLLCCIQEAETTAICKKCPYSNADDGCREMLKDSLDYIQQLEAAARTTGGGAP